MQQRLCGEEPRQLDCIVWWWKSLFGVVRNCELCAGWLTKCVGSLRVALLSPWNTPNLLSSCSKLPCLTLDASTASCTLATCWRATLRHVQDTRRHLCQDQGHRSMGCWDTYMHPLVSAFHLIHKGRKLHTRCQLEMQCQLSM